MQPFEFDNDNHEHQQQHQFLNKFEDFALPTPSLLQPVTSSSESLSNGHHPSTEYKLSHLSYSNDNDDDSSSSTRTTKNNQNYVVGRPVVVGHHVDDYVENNMDESFPVDLSNDIAINQMLLDQGAPFNPDAEIFSIDELDQQQQLEQRPLRFTDIK